MNNIAVFCFIEFENQILLVKKNYGNKSWTLPGGAIMQKEGITEALIREVKEETGQTIIHTDFVASFYSKDHYSIALCFQARLNKLEDISFNPAEISDARLFGLDALPEPMSARYLFWLQSYRDMKNNSPKNLFQYA